VLVPAAVHWQHPDHAGSHPELLPSFCERRPSAVARILPLQDQIRWHMCQIDLDANTKHCK